MGVSSQVSSLLIIMHVSGYAAATFVIPESSPRSHSCIRSASGPISSVCAPRGSRRGAARMIRSGPFRNDGRICKMTRLTRFLHFTLADEDRSHPFWGEENIRPLTFRGTVQNCLEPNFRDADVVDKFFMSPRILGSSAKHRPTVSLPPPPRSGQYLKVLLGIILDDSRIRGGRGMDNVLELHVAADGGSKVATHKTDHGDRMCWQEAVLFTMRSP